MSREGEFTGNRLESGQTLIEVIVASVVGIFVVSALTFATIFSLRNANFAKTSAQATKLAQEGIERVRTGRDRNQLINGLSESVTSWDGIGSSTCSGSDAMSDSIWCYQINNTCSNQLNPNCYFNVTDTGTLNSLGNGSSIPALAELISQFKRVVILSDDADYQTQKKVTVLVTWRDFAGDHESKLVTILRKL